MVLEFTKREGAWEAFFKAESIFALHIEGVLESNVRVYQSTSQGGQYALVRESSQYPAYGEVYDFDFIGEVFPKFIKVVCASQPTYAEVVSNGKITELKFQSKSVNLTSNGSKTIKPDAGFAALSSVRVNVNVSGGGSGSGELKRDDVNFFDYDGTLLYSYTWDEAKKLTELPAAPEHEGLLTYGWNYTIEDFRELASTGFKAKVDVAVECYDGDGNLMMGDFVLIVPRGTRDIGSYEQCIFEEVSLPTSVELNAGSFRFCTFLNEVRCSYAGAFSSYYPVFDQCIMKSFYINSRSNEKDDFSIRSFEGSLFNYSIEIPETLYLYHLDTYVISTAVIRIPASTEEINSIEFSSGINAILDFTKCTAVPELYNLSVSPYHRNNTIIVPDDLYDEWINATNWSEGAEYILKASEVPESLLN